jgi:putative effector of murein hydrolase
MSPFELNLLHVLHVASIVTLLAFTFYGFAGAPESRKMVMIVTGIATLIALLTGIRMWQGMYSWHGGWVIVKLVCWLALSGLAGIGYKKRDSKGAWMTILLTLAVVALVMVYWKPWA